MLPRLLFAALAALAALAIPAARADAGPTPCRVEGLKNEVLCGHVTRALDPAQPAGRTIDVHYLVVPATARRKASDPVFFLAGGPGQSAIALAGSVTPLLLRLGNQRDLVFVDQRGTGRSAALACDDEDDEHRPLAERIDLQRMVERLRACRARLAAQPHGDLRQYTTTIAMADLDAVRAALGAERINLVGGSYGTRAALEYLRQFPQRVRRAVLDGVAPPDMALSASMSADAQRVLDAQFDACERDAACAARHPRLRERFRAWLASLPREVEVTDPQTGDAQRLRLTREAVLSALRGPLYAPAMAAALPEALGAAIEGRVTPLAGLGSLGLGGRRLRLAEIEHFAVVCAEDMPRLAASADRPGADLGESLAQPYRALCADWPRSEVPAAFYAIAPSPAPVLLFSGGLDPVTPPRHGERVARALGAKARHVVVDNAGHGVMALGCARDLIHRFIASDDEAQALAVDATCLAAIPRPPVFRPADPALAPTTAPGGRS
ncbi:alpha/beta hydrolase [Caldimonas sp. KR1-144]|uniref:alpha/beta hydrolase n=1 Tax=Caldimonas sp. KR1-144 TaxID=3400911 RepID=UPI003C0F003C